MQPAYSDSHSIASSASSQLTYDAVGDPQKMALLFIHGTPGRRSMFDDYLAAPQLAEHFYLVSIDRPGWGESTTPSGKTESLQQQSSLLGPLIEQLVETNQGAGVVIVGHSLGASLAPIVARDYPDQIKGMVLLSGALNPDRAAPRWYNRWADLYLVRALLPKNLRKANAEMKRLQADLQSVQNAWQEYSKPLVVLQGTKDRFVYPDHADYAEQVLAHNSQASVVRLPKAGHFTPWRQQSDVLAAIDKVHQLLSP